MAYQALYRTYRPRDFDEVAGQEHITKTFKNALLNNKLTHAYLFSGPRGTGKTSVAKIIAKAVNCVHAPVANPCNSCENCIGIDKNMINDVIEIDAASNNGVDEIREIRDKVKYLPGSGKYKVYIIDEVHMLSTGAFNALLKTLEEPPKHVIFILATTEPHKIPATIHSRCQRFDFRGIGLNEMIPRLEEIIEKENINIVKEAVQLIAESAEGGMRDAISLLDQVISYSEDTVNVDDVHAIRGSISDTDIIALALALEKSDVVAAVNVLEKLIADGKEAQKLVDDVIRFYRDLLMIKNTDVDSSSRLLYQNTTFIELAQKLSNSRIFYYINVLHDTQVKIRYSGNAQLYLELAFVKMVDDVQKQEVLSIERLETLETEIKRLKRNLDEIQEQGLTLSKDENEEVETPDEEIEEESMEEEQEGLASEEVEVIEQEEIPKKEETSKPLDPIDKMFEQYKDKNYTTFDIRFVEDVLNNGNRELKIDMIKKWYDIERKNEGENLEFAKQITEGDLVATNGAMIIVSYDSYPMCNHVMKPKIKARLLDLLEEYYGRRMMFLALPKDLWEVISQEFISKYRARKDDQQFIHLSPINHPKLHDIPDVNETYEDVESKSLKEAKDLFGDIVKVKKQGE